MRIHIISLDQDLNKLREQMDSIDPSSKDFETLDFEFNWISGQIAGISHILDIAEGRI